MSFAYQIINNSSVKQITIILLEIISRANIVILNIGALT